MAEPKRQKLGPQEAGRRGGQTTSQRYGPNFYSEIGRRGGQAVSSNREHMSRIGRKGGKAGIRGQNAA